jgi:hypothetical protein
MEKGRERRREVEGGGSCGKSGMEEKETVIQRQYDELNLASE